MTGAIVVWQLTDRRRGHERPCEGLIRALASLLPLEHHVIDVAHPGLRRFGEFVIGLLPAARYLPPPRLIIGAGRRCQWPLLAARRARGGRALYLMRPALPPAWFDLCIIPRHDQPRAGPRVIVSEGPLNPMRPAAERDPDLGLMLLGGPSAHHRWDTTAVCAQLAAVVAAEPAVTWYASDSRRSPPDLAAALRTLPGVKFVSHRETGSEWLPDRLARARCAWISADSVAMIYEALSAGAEVGIIDVPAESRDRIAAVADDLCQRGIVTSVRDLGRGQRAATPRKILNEAQRCAQLIIARWPELVPGAA